MARHEITAVPPGFAELAADGPLAAQLGVTLWGALMRLCQVGDWASDLPGAWATHQGLDELSAELGCAVPTLRRWLRDLQAARVIVTVPANRALGIAYERHVIACIPGLTVPAGRGPKPSRARSASPSPEIGSDTFVHEHFVQEENVQERKILSPVGFHEENPPSGSNSCAGLVVVDKERLLKNKQHTPTQCAPTPAGTPTDKTPSPTGTPRAPGRRYGTELAPSWLDKALREIGYIGDISAEVSEVTDAAAFMRLVESVRSTPGNRSPAAVLGGILKRGPDAVSAAIRAIPGTRGTAPARPDWCGHCDATTRQRTNDAGLPYRCPTCHPLAVTG
jgi:hypothetical protein